MVCARLRGNHYKHVSVLYTVNTSWSGSKCDIASHNVIVSESHTMSYSVHNMEMLSKRVTIIGNPQPQNSVAYGDIAVIQCYSVTYLHIVTVTLSNQHNCHTQCQAVIHCHVCSIKLSHTHFYIVSVTKCKIVIYSHIVRHCHMVTHCEILSHGDTLWDIVTWWHIVRYCHMVTHCQTLSHGVTLSDIVTWWHIVRHCHMVSHFSIPLGL